MKKTPRKAVAFFILLSSGLSAAPEKKSWLMEMGLSEAFSANLSLRGLHGQEIISFFDR